MTKKSRKSRKSKGLGDSIEKFTEATGIKKAVEVVTKAVGIEDCGCEKRKLKLNEWWPYSRKPNKITNGEWEVLDHFFKNQRGKIVTAEKQIRLIKVSDRIFNEKREITSCPSCLREFVDRLRLIWLNHKPSSDYDQDCASEA